MTDAIIDAAVRAVLAYPADARIVMALAAQDIRAAALEEAARVAEDYRKTSPVSDVIAEDIRALKSEGHAEHKE